jgi:hypothetical protein
MSCHCQKHLNCDKKYSDSWLYSDKAARLLGGGGESCQPCTVSSENHEPSYTQHGHPKAANNQINFLFFSKRLRNWKLPIMFAIYLSVCRHSATIKQQNGFSWKVILESLKFVDTLKFWSKSDNNNAHFTWKHARLPARMTGWGILLWWTPSQPCREGNPRGILRDDVFI